MAGKMVQFPSNGHTTDGYLATPASRKGPGVVVIQEWWGLVGHIKSVCDRFAAAAFAPPVEGYVRRMLWALAAEGVIPGDACDDPWGPSLPPGEREAVARAVREARSPRPTPP